MKHTLRSHIAFLPLAIAGPCLAQVPAEPFWGINCLWVEQDYLDTLNNSYFPPDQTSVIIADVGEHACRPDGVDSLDIYGAVIPFFHPISGIFLEDVERKPMFKTIYRHLTFSNTTSGLEVEADQDILAVELVANSGDPLAQPYVYLGTGTIDYNAIYTAITTHAEADDFHDGCGNAFSLDGLNMNNEPAIIDVYPWPSSGGGGSRAVLFWRCQGATTVKWYIQHVMLNYAPYVYPCVPPGNGVLDLNACATDVTPPQFTNVSPQWLYCAFNPPVLQAAAVDDYDSAPTVQYLGEDQDGDNCYMFRYRHFSATDGCGNSTSVTQELEISFITNIWFAPPLADALIAADDVIASPYDTPIASSCLEPYVEFASDTYAGNAVTVEVFANVFGGCVDFPLSGSFTLTATSVNFFAALPQSSIVPLGTALPAPVDIAEVNTHNPFFHFSLTEDTTFVSFREDCLVYTVTRTYRTFNDNNVEIPALSFVQTIDVVDIDAPVVGIGADAEVPSINDVPVLEFTATDNYGVETVNTFEENVPGPCPEGFTIVRTVTATDSCGLVGSAVQHIIVGCPTGIADGASVAELRVFPNPSSGVFTIRTRYAPCSYEVLDMSGRIVQSGRLTSTSTTLDLRGRLPIGLYELRVAAQGGVQRCPVVISGER